MRYLLDSHAFLWFNEGSSELSDTARSLIENEGNDLVLSSASLWEISIKSSIGKLEIAGGYESVIEDIQALDLVILNINFSHTLKQYSLPFHHKDPFDRIIASQAITEGLSLISKDQIFDKYFEQAANKRVW